MWFLRPPKSRRRWHLFTWLAAVPALVFVALVQVAGIGREEHLAPRDDVFEARVTYEHGWPLPWAERSLDYRLERVPLFSGLLRPGKNEASGVLFDYPAKFRGEDMSWTCWQAWPTFANRWRIKPLGLVVNLAVAIAIVALSMLATEFWLRRRGRMARFRIVDFLVVAAAVAAIVGLWRWDRAVVRGEHDVASRIAFDTSPAGMGQRKLIATYVGPEWLARLCGNERLVPLFHRFTAISTPHSLVATIDFDSLGELHHLASARVKITRQTASQQGLESLARLPQVKALVISNLADAPLPPARYADLTSIELVAFEYRVPYEQLLLLKGMPRLQHLSVRPDWYTAEQLAALKAALPGVSIGIGEPPPTSDL